MQKLKLNFLLNYIGKVFHLNLWLTLYMFQCLMCYAAEYAQLPLIPPFLQPSAEYVNGVNFASAGAGILPETNQGLVHISALHNDLL